MIAELNLDAPQFTLRDYQTEAVIKVREGWATYSRQLIDMATGTGKTSLFAAIAAEHWDMGLRTLVLENRDALVRQTAKRIKEETGLDADIEMAGDHASPFAPVVVASVQTLARTARLTGFADNHFGLVVQDEAHHSLATSHSKVANYFHYGTVSLNEGWEPPLNGTYQPIARILGVTATPELSSKRTLAEAYQAVGYQYQLLQAVADGWLVPIVAKNIPLEINLRGLRAGRTVNGSDLRPEEISERMIPVIEALAKQICQLAHDRKTIAFVPSVECARLLAAAIERNGLRGIFVSGECLDIDEKTDAYRAAGPGTVLCNCALYVEGADFPDTSCVAIARATKSVGFLRQMVGRGTRVLPGTVDGLATPKERRTAIAASAKPHLLLIDPLWRIDDIDLCDAYDLYTNEPEVKEKMKALGPPSLESAKEAERDFIRALEKEAKKHARKQARVIDPLSWALELGDEKLASYVPERAWEMGKPTPQQLDFIRRQHIDPAKITTKGLAQKVIGILMNRITLKLATPTQLEFMKQLGLITADSAKLTRDEATRLIDQKIRR